MELHWYPAGTPCARNLIMASELRAVPRRAAALSALRGGEERGRSRAPVGRCGGLGAEASASPD
eukprot:940307-Alexandrium_andersonii.AAC.1